MNSAEILAQAKKYVGQAEVPGPKSNSWIKDLWMNLKGGKWFWTTYGEDDSKLPWCGAFCAKVLADLGLGYPAKYASALAWATHGTKSMIPTLGAIAVLTRSGGGHVGFVSGVTSDGKYVRLVGGNQGDVSKKEKSLKI